MLNNKVIDLQTFISTLERYRIALEEMCKLTEDELKRVGSFEIKVVEDNALLEKEATRFINHQMFVYLDKLGEIVKEIPNFALPGTVFLTKDIQQMQEQVLAHLKASGNPEYFIK